MLNRLLPCLAVLGFVALPASAAPVEAGKDKPKTPALIVRAQSVDVLLNNFRYLAGLVGRDEEAKQLTGILGGPKVLEGIDAKRPLALYVIFGEAGLADITAVGIIPITEEKAFLGLIEKLDYKTEKDKEGYYTVSGKKLPTPVYFRFANKSAYVTALNPDVIAKDKLLLPSAVLGEGKLPLASATVHIDQIPEFLRDIAVDSIKDKLKEAKDKNKENETPAQHGAKVEIIDTVSKYLISAIKDGGDLTMQFNVDQPGKELTAELAMTAKDGSMLSKSIAALGKQKSVVSGLVGRESVASFALDLPNDEKLAEAIQGAIKDTIKQGIDKETDPQKKAVLEKLYQAIEPVIKFTDADVALDLRGPHKSGLYTAVGGIKVASGAKLDKALREVLALLQPAGDDTVKFDVEKSGDVAIHRFAAKAIPPAPRQTLGENDAYFAIRTDVLFFAVGEDSLAALKDALKVEPKAGKPIQVEVSVARVAQAMSKDKPEAPKAAAKAFGDNKDTDKVRLSLEGGKELKLRFTLRTPVLTFFHLMESGADLK